MLIFLVPFLYLEKITKKIKIKKISPIKKSKTLLKKYLSTQLFTQLKPKMYSSGLETLKFGLAPALDHNSYQLFIFVTLSVGIDHCKFSKQVKEIG